MWVSGDSLCLCPLRHPVFLPTGLSPGKSGGGGRRVPSGAGCCDGPAWLGNSHAGGVVGKYQLFLSCGLGGRWGARGPGSGLRFQRGRGRPARSASKSY